MLFGKFNTKEEAIDWATEVLTLEIPFCPELMEDSIKKAIEILLTYLPDPQVGITYKDKVFLKKEYQILCPSPAQAVEIINK